jgi:predicted lipid-binding transport protein (Tim44 family)
MPSRWLPSLATLVALALGLVTWTEEANARLEGAFGFAGVNAATSIVFDTVAAFDDSLQPGATQPSYHGGSLGGLFGGFAAGLLGSGVIGVLFGHGAIGELSGIASILGLLFQLTLLVMLARLIWTWWRDDTADAFANLSPRQLADAYGHSRHEVLPDIDSGPALDPAFDEAADDGLGRPK